MKEKFNVAFIGRGMSYQTSVGGGTTKAVLESLTALLALYAAYSELSGKLFDLIPISTSYSSGIIQRVVTSTLAGVVCGIILLSTDATDRHLYIYARIPRNLAKGCFILVLISLGFSVWELATAPKPYIEPYSASFTVSPEAWHLRTAAPAASSRSRIYEVHLTSFDDTAKKYKNLTISISPAAGFKLIRVNPETNKTIQVTQDPLKVTSSDPNRWEWFFPNFNENMDWKVVVTIEQIDATMNLSQTLPIQATIYFSN